MKVKLIDFEDSFTLNIFSELHNLGIKTEIIGHDSAHEYLESLVNGRKKEAVILGPGPGHPDERNDIIKSVSKLIGRRDLFILGICLGHQIVARSLGLPVEKCLKPSHGEVETYRLSPEAQRALSFESVTISAQRYNSLVPKCDQKRLNGIKKRGIDALCVKNECQMLFAPGLLTYQFHPESVGTSFRSRFFLPLKNFLL